MHFSPYMNSHPLRNEIHEDTRTKGKSIIKKFVVDYLFSSHVGLFTARKANTMHAIRASIW